MLKFLLKNESTHVTYNKRRIFMSHDVKNMRIRFSIRKSTSEHILYIAIECVALTLMSQSAMLIVLCTFDQNLYGLSYKKHVFRHNYASCCR